VIDFDSIQRRMEISRARSLTENEATNLFITPTWNKTAAKARELKKVFTYLTLPDYLITGVGAIVPPSLAVWPRLLFQYNVTLSHNFYIVEQPAFQSNWHPYFVNGSLTVKWRVGSTVHRYRLAGAIGVTTQNIFFPRYNGELIGKNCCFEFWFTGYNVLINPKRAGTLQDFVMRTSITSIPISESITRIDVLADLPEFLGTLGNEVPEVVPTPQDDLTYLDNAI
jgi:hypothetical protein